MDLIYEHFKMDNPQLSKEDGKARDEEYEQTQEGMQMSDQEHYEDPDFDSAWNEDSTESDTNDQQWEEV